MRKVKDLKDIRGQEHVKRGLEVALCGKHNILLIGPRKAGKAMFAEVFTDMAGGGTVIEDLPYIKNAGKLLKAIRGRIFAATILPCPCGNFTDPKKECHCTPEEIRRYLESIPQKVLDKIDIQLEVPKISYELLTYRRSGDSTTEVIKRVDAFKANQVNPARLNKEADELLKLAILEIGISAKAYDKILAVSKTIAKMDGKGIIEAHHISEAISYRSLDRNMWG